jgi:cell division inhibitor SepF
VKETTMSGGMWRKTLIYLGLYEEPDEHDDLPEQFAAPQRDPRGIDREPVGTPEATNVRPLRAADAGSPHVRAMERPVATGTAVRTTVVNVERFEDCEVIGARYRANQAVLFDLATVDKTTARRVLDFVAGTTYALRGSLTRVGSRAFLLVPEGAEVAHDEVDRLEAMGYRIGGGA